MLHFFVLLGIIILPVGLTAGAHERQNTIGELLIKAERTDVIKFVDKCGVYQEESFSEGFYSHYIKVLDEDKSIVYPLVCAAEKEEESIYEFIIESCNRWNNYFELGVLSNAVKSCSYNAFLKFRDWIDKEEVGNYLVMAARKGCSDIVVDIAEDPGYREQLLVGKPFVVKLRSGMHMQMQKTNALNFALLNAARGGIYVQ
jgi:hypothetical protein